MKFPDWAVQYPWEWYTLARVLEMWHIHDAESILEIGLHDGGSMRGWMQMAPNARFVGVDTDINHMKMEGLDLHNLCAIQGNSLDPGVIELVRQHGPFDFIFIDGDHSYEGVWGDFSAYKGMVRTGTGIMGFHDISNMDDCGTFQFWQEIQRQMYHTVTISCTTKMGVGLLLDGCAHE